MAETLWGARGKIREVKPTCTPSQATNFINRRIQNVMDTRVWSDTMKIGIITFPAATTAGTVNMTPDSDLVAGNGTAWPINDRINTVSVNPIVDSPGYMEIQPGSGFISKIKPADLILIDQENASVTEVLTVQSVGPVSFTAYCQYAHDANVTLQSSSLAGQQFATDDYTRTVQAVLSATSLQVDMAYGGLPQTAVSYTILKRYCQISPTAKYLKYCWDAIAGQEVGVLRDEQWVLAADPQLTSTGNPMELAQMHPTPGGTMQWHCWPPPAIRYALGVFYQDSWPVLKYDTDLLPPFLNSEIIIAGGCADALRTKVIKSSGGRDDYYSPQDAMTWEREFDRLLENAVQSDQGRRTNYLSNYREMVATVSTSWLRSHAVSANAGWGGRAAGW